MRTRTRPLHAAPVDRPALGAAAVAVAQGEQPQPACGIGLVVAIGDRHVAVSSDQGHATARVAASCLVRPSPGDRVAFLFAGEASWIVAVLERAADAGETLLELDGPARVRVRDGDLAFEVSGEVAVSATSIKATSRSAQLVTETAESMGNVLRSTWGSVHLVGATLSRVFERVLDHSRTSRRVVEELDSLEAGHLDHRVKGMASLQAEHVLTTGERLVKTRGGQIHLG